MNEKGSLELSIQAIVIIVIAFVVLGLGLGFVRGQFKSITETSSSVQEQIRQQILEDLRTGDKKLSFPAQEVEIGKKSSSIIAVGVKNVKPTLLKYKILLEAKGGNDIFGEDISDNFLLLAEEDELSPTDARVVPIRITSETSSGTGQFKLSVIDTTSGEPGETYDSKTFFITVR